MSPSAYYCWLHERRFAFGRKRAEARTDENFPGRRILLGPLWFAALILIALGLLGLLLRFTGGKPIASVIYVAVGVVAFTCALTHRLFAALVWNQRAARQRAAGTATPAVRPAWWVRWLLGPLYVLVIGFVTPLALLTGLENVRGAMAWRRVRTELQARGERLFLREVAPPAVPAEQNLASLPIFADLFAYGRQTNIINGRAVVSAYQWMDTNAMNRYRVFQLPDRDLPDRQRKADAQASRLVSLADWAAAFRTAISNRVEVEKTPAHSRRGDQDFSPPYPAASANADDATVVLTALSVADAELAPICEASQRPYARFPLHWDDGFNTLLPHLTHFKSLNRLLELRTQARLAKGDLAGAFADAQCALRLVDALREEPWLISLLVRVAQSDLATRTVWHGIAAHQWTDAQLREFQERFTAANFIRDTALSLEGERSAAISVLEGWATNRRQMREGVDELGMPDSSDDSQAVAASPSTAPMIPRGWIRQNQAELARYLQLGIDRARQLATNAPPPGYAAALREFNAASDVEAGRLGGQTTPYNVFVKLLAPALDKAVSKGVRATQVARMAATGCALERFRLKHGAYPDSLARLAPEFMPEPPRDMMDGQALRYTRTEDGLFRLWSVGADGVDNGGATKGSTSRAEANPKGHLSDPKARREEQGLDWVWPK